jgi:hypothetical protein
MGHTENPLRGAAGKPNKFNDQIGRISLYWNQLIAVHSQKAKAEGPPSQSAPSL